MSFQSEIKAKFSPNRLDRMVECFATTASLEFWVWDPNENPDIPYTPKDAPGYYRAQILLAPTPRQRKESLQVNCRLTKERTLVAIDKCLIPTDEIKKCDGLLFEGIERPTQLIWIELKMNMKREGGHPKTLEDRIIGKSNESDTNAFDQILSSMQSFRDKNINLDECSNLWHIGIPKELKSLANKSNAINAKKLRIRKTHKIRKISIDPILSLD